MKHISIKKLLTTLVVTTAVAASATIGASACTTIYVGANRTTEGTPFVARTEDYGSNMNKMWFVSEAGAFKQGEKWIGCPGYGEFEWAWTHDTYRFTYFTNDIFNGKCPECGQENPTHWSYTEFGTNEKGVSVSATETISGNTEVKKVDPNVKTKVDGIVGIEETDIPTIILGEAATAREGVELLAEIYDDYGAFYDSGIFICDKDEVWYIENCSGTQYVALKLNDDMIFLEPNLAVIGLIDLDDPNVIASDRLIEVAQKAGTFVGNADENIIDYRASYARLPGVGAPRMVDGLNFLNKNYKYVEDDLKADNTKFTISNVDKDGKIVPLYTNIEADRKLTTNDVFNYYHLSSIGKPSNQEIEIFQLFKDAKTVEEGTVGWVGVGNMSYNVFIPYYPVAMKAAPGTAKSPIYQGYENRASDDIYDGYQVSLPVVTQSAEKPQSFCIRTSDTGSYAVYPEGWEQSYYFSFEGLGGYMANAKYINGAPVSDTYKANAKAELQELQDKFIAAVKDKTLTPANTVEKGKEMAKEAHELALKLIPVAAIGDQYYESVSEAVAAAKDGQTVQLQREATENITISGKSITLDLNGYKLSAPNGKDAITVEAGAGLTVKGNGAVETTGAEKAAIQNNGTTTIKGGIFVQNVTAPVSNTYYAFSNSGALTVDAGTFVQTVTGKPASNSYYMFDEIGSLTINGGFFNCKNFTPEGNQKLTIKGGYFAFDPSAYLAADQVAVASGKDGYPFTVAAKNVDANTDVPEPEAKVTANTSGKSDAVADAMTSAAEALDEMTVDGTVKAAAMSVANDPKVITDTLIAKAQAECGADAVIAVEPYLDIQVTDATLADGKITTFTLDIKAKYDLTASGNSKTITLAEGQLLPVEAGVVMEISIPLPSSFVVPNDNVVYVKHIMDDDTYRIYKGTVAKGILTFTNPDGFSEFVVGEEPAASVTASGKTTYYLTLQEAVDAVSNKGTVKLESDCDEIVYVSKELTFTLSNNGNTFTGKIVPGGGYDITEKNGTYTISVRSSSGDDDSSSGGSSSSGYAVTVNSASNGSVTASPKRAEKGASVTLTVKADSGYVLDALTVTDKNGDAVKTTEKSNGTYTFQMPASAVTVKATFTKIGDGWSNPFGDVSSSSWYYNAVRYAVENGLLSGTSANTFAPNSSLTRGMLVQILWSMEGKPSVSAEIPFSDVAGSAWYADAVRWATAKNIVSGIGDGMFAPEASVTREQLALILYNYAGKPASSQQLSFADADQASSWAVDALRWAVGSGLISGKDGNVLDPKGTATRAEVAQIMMKFDMM